jgi:hypothetical protein
MMWKEAVVVYCKIVSQYLPRETEANHKMLQSEYLVFGPRIESGNSRVQSRSTSPPEPSADCRKNKATAAPFNYFLSP